MGNQINFPSLLQKPQGHISIDEPTLLIQLRDKRQGNRSQALASAHQVPVYSARGSGTDPQMGHCFPEFCKTGGHKMWDQLMQKTTNQEALLIATEAEAQQDLRKIGLHRMQSHLPILLSVASATFGLGLNDLLRLTLQSCPCHHISIILPTVLLICKQINKQTKNITAP